MKHYRFVDFATQSYVATVAMLVALFHGNRVGHWGLLVAAHVVCLVSVHVMIRAAATRPDIRWLDFLRNFYPVMLYTAFYRETGALNEMFVASYLDPRFIRLEERLFGFQPSLAFMQSLPYQPVSETLYAAYFSYYLMIAGVGLALYFRKPPGFRHYVSVVSFVFYVCYLIYIFVPVIGPRLFFQDYNGYSLPADLMPSGAAPTYPATVERGIFYQIMGFIYDHFEAPGAAFPSSHVIVAIATLYFSWRYLPRLRPIHFALVVLLCVSTVYCRYHYAVDVIAGLITACVLIPAGNRFYFRFSATGPASDTPSREGTACDQTGIKSRS